MNEFPQKQLLVNYLLGICTEREEKEVEEWLDVNPSGTNLLQQTAQELAQGEKYPLPDRTIVKQGLIQKLDSMTPDLAKADLHYYKKEIAKPAFYKKRGFLIKIAAAFLVVVMAGAAGVYFGEIQSVESEPEPVFKQTTLSYGQTATLQFEDGSQVKLNGGSTLRYPETFAEARREVFLEGEAFFEIEPDRSRPFIVYARDTETRVLGTSFNIKAFEGDNDIQIVVAEGRVGVSYGKPEPDSDAESRSEMILLENNQWIKYRSDGRIQEKGEGDIREMIAWKDRVLLFSNKSFGEVVKMLERWYAVDITIEEPDLKSTLLEGEHLDVSLREVLNSIQLVMDFDYTINEKKVRIYKE